MRNSSIWIPPDPNIQPSGERSSKAESSQLETRERVEKAEWTNLQLVTEVLPGGKENRFVKGTTEPITSVIPAVTGKGKRHVGFQEAQTE